jgi:inosine-uridine nucleoside N-ribohydrolase
MPEIPRLVIDCDPGIDDAIALHVIAAAAREGRLELAGIVAAAGNVPIWMTARNAAFLRSHLALAVPVYRGVDRDTGVDAHDFHGPDGLGGCYREGHHGPEPGDGVAWLVEQARQGAAQGRPLTLLAVGPLTNVAAALRLEPRLPDLLSHVVVMGGAFERRGNITPFAEFNFYADAAAAAEVFASSLPVTVVPLDVTEQVLMTEDDVASLDRRTGPTLATRLLRASIACYRAAEGIDACVMHDALAALAVLHPEVISGAAAKVKIVTHGPEIGRSVAVRDPRGTAWIAQGVDVDAARAMLLDALTATPVAN